MIRRSFWFVLVAASIVVPFGGSAGAQEAANTVTVGASEKVDIEADIGIATFGTRAKDRSAQEATSELSRKTDAILAALRGAGFTTDELSTTNIRLSRDCIRRCRDRNKGDGIPAERVMGYVGSARVTLETNQLDRLGAAVDAAVGAGANSVRGISYDVEDKDAAVLEALRLAMRQAEAKGQVIAEEAGRTLGPALVVEEGRTDAPERYTLVDDLAATSLGTTSGGADAAIPFPVDPPTLHASARVTVTWELL